jgi:hypothetical protein
MWLFNNINYILHGTVLLQGVEQVSVNKSHEDWMTEVFVYIQSDFQ